MSRTLDKLIVMHKQNTQNLRQVRKYSSEGDAEIDKAFEELAKAQVLDDDEKLAAILTLEPDEYKELEKDLHKGSSEEKNSYRYKMLPRIYSNLEKIDSSPQLARKLISYYLRNRRKEKMYRLYGRRKSYSNRVMADYLIHEMYMDLGRVIYYSWVDKIGEWAKKKVENIDILRKTYESIRTIIDFASKAIEKLKSIDVEKLLAKLLAGGASLTAAIVYIMAGIFQDAFNRLDPGQKFAAVFMAILGFLLIVVGVGFMAYFIFRTILTKLIYAFLPKALVTYYKGYRLINRFIRALSKLLGNMELMDLIGMMGAFVKASNDGDSNSKEKVMGKVELVAEKIESDRNISEYFSLNPSDLAKLKDAIEQGETLTLKFSAAVLKDVAKVISYQFEVPQYIDTDYFNVSKRASLEQMSRENKGNEQLPPELVILLILTSPNVVINLSAGQAKATIKFKVWQFCKEYGELDISQVIDFLNAYMKAFAEKRDELSEYLKTKIEKAIA